MDIRIRLSQGLRQAVVEQLQGAYARGQVRLVRRIHALMSIIEGKSVDEVAALLDLGEQTVRDYVNAFLYRGMASLVYQKPAGRPPRSRTGGACAGFQPGSPSRNDLSWQGESPGGSSPGQVASE